MRDFRHLYRKGIANGNRDLSVKLLEKPDQEITRFAFVISNKTEKKAVARNRSKRQLREIIRHTLSRIRPGYDVAITIKRSFSLLTHEQQERTVMDLLKKSGLLRKV